MNRLPDPFNLIICGIGGQGNIFMSRLIGRALTRRSYYVTIGETFGAAQRGGSVLSMVRASTRKFYGPLIPEGCGHLILSLEPLEALRNLIAYGNSDTMVISNTTPRQPISVLSGHNKYPGWSQLSSAINKLCQKAWFVDATPLAMDLGNPVLANVVLTGSVAKAGSLSLCLADMENEIQASFSGPALVANLEALRKGYAAI
jgi:indolepyruvate ferredoxin oxidoreductase, beta subunit